MKSLKKFLTCLTVVRTCLTVSRACLTAVRLAMTLTIPIGFLASQVEARETHFPHGISVYGVSVLPGIGGNVYTGNVKYVDSGASNNADTAQAGTKDYPFATMNYADTQMTDNNGDIIIVMPGHVEVVTAAGGLDLNKAGVTWLGLGEGSNRPTVRFTTATTSDINLDGANIVMYNFLFESRVEMLAAPIDINAADCRLLNIETRDIDSAGSATNFIVTDANADRLLIDGWRHIGTSTTGNNHPISALSLTGGDDIIVRNFNIYGNFDIAAIMGTSTACTRLNINGGNSGNFSYIWTENATDTAISVLTSTGFIGPNIAAMLQDNAANITEAMVGASMQFIPPLPIVNLAGEQATATINITTSQDS
jgi:hypothetical protein